MAPRQIRPNSSGLMPATFAACGNRLSDTKIDGIACYSITAQLPKAGERI
jgi:hypothetical protein